MIWAILAQFTVIGVLSALNNAEIIDSSTIFASPWFIIGVQLLIFILPLFVWLVMKEEKFSSNIPAHKLGAKNIILIVAISLLIQPAMMTLSGISSLFFTNYVSEMIYSSLEQPLWLILLASAVTPAICEELVFRGYLQTQQRDRRLKQAAILNGLFFAIIHLNLQQFLYAFVMGIIFVYMVHYTRSIWAGILSHFVVNAAQGLLGRWAFSNTNANAEVQAAERIIPAVSPVVEATILVGGFALLLAPVLFLLFREFFRYNQRKHGDIIEINEAIDSTDTDEEQIPAKNPPFFDKYMVIVIVIFTLFQLVLFAGRNLST